MLNGKPVSAELRGKVALIVGFEGTAYDEARLKLLESGCLIRRAQTPGDIEHYLGIFIPSFAVVAQDGEALDDAERGEVVSMLEQKVKMLVCVEGSEIPDLVSRLV